MTDSPPTPLPPLALTGPSGSPQQSAQDRSGTVTWLLLALAIGVEVVASLSLKGAIGHPALYVVVVLGYGSAFGLLSLVLRRGMGLAVAYGIWGAVGVVATAVLSAIVFDEHLTPLMLAGIALVVAGVLAIEIGSQRGRRAAAAASAHSASATPVARASVSEAEEGGR